MTESNQTPNASPSSSTDDYEGTDPDRRDREEPKPRLGVSTVQVGASAAAAVTSALAASFFGVAGTLIGAAVGSIVSTIAGALYSEYLSRAHQRIRVTRDVVIQRIPSEVIATTPLRRLTRPTDLPGRESLRPIGDERGNETVAVPVEGAEDLLRHPEGMAPLPTLTSSGAARAGSNGAGNHGGTGRPVPAPTATPWWKKPVVAMSAVSVAGFVIAIGVVVATETAIGHPVSGGTSGTTISNLGRTSSETEVTPTESATEEPADAEATTAPADEDEAPVEPTETAVPEATEGAEGEPTAEPTAESTDSDAAPTADTLQVPEGDEAPAP